LVANSELFDITSILGTVHEYDRHKNATPQHYRTCETNQSPINKTDRMMINQHSLFHENMQVVEHAVTVICILQLPCYLFVLPCKLRFANCVINLLYMMMNNI